MSEPATKDDLREFSMILINKIDIMLKSSASGNDAIAAPLWMKTKSVRKMLDISPGSVQTLRLSGKVRFKKVLGSYYYNIEDLQKLFSDEKQKK